MILCCAIFSFTVLYLLLLFIIVLVTITHFICDNHHICSCHYTSSQAEFFFGHVAFVMYVHFYVKRHITERVIL